MKTLLLVCIASTLLTPLANDLASVHEVSEVRRTSFEFEESSTLVETSVLMNGEEGPGMPGMEQEKSLSRQGVFVDSISAVNESRPSAFQREFTDLTETHEFHMSDPMGGEHDNDGESESDLEGVQVRFALEDGEFVASFVDESAGDAGLLKNVEALLPWTDLLPEGEVDAGDDWKLEPEVIWRTLHLGGDLAFSADESEGGPAKITAPPGLDDIDFDGEATATLAAFEEIDGVRHARITLEIDFTTLQDLTDLAADMSEESPDDAPPGMVMPDIDSMEVEMAYEGQGTMLWNLEAHHMTRFELELETQSTQLIVMNMEMGPETMEIEQSMVFEGEQHLAVEVEVTRE